VKKQKMFLLLTIALSLIFMSSLAYAISNAVIASGTAPIISGNTSRARIQAIAHAQRNAVEKGIGTLIDSQTVVQNALLIQDKIYSQASGYITDYSIISEGPTPDGTTYEVCIQAQVQVANIKDDLRALGILRQQIGNPRFIAVYIPETDSSAYRHSRVVKAAERAINEVFVNKGFVVLDRMFINHVYHEIEWPGHIDIDDLSALALKYRADLLLVYDVVAAKKVGGTSKYFGGISLDLALRAVAPATRDIIASKQGDTYVRTPKTTTGSYYENTMAAKAVTKLAKRVSEALVGDTVAYFERQIHGGTRYECWFRNFDQKEIFTIVEIIENMAGFKDKNIRNQSPKDFQVDVNYQGKKFDFQRELYSGLKNQGIEIEFQQAEGNRFLVFKAGTENPFADSNINTH